MQRLIDEDRETARARRAASSAAAARDAALDHVEASATNASLCDLEIATERARRSCRVALRIELAQAASDKTARYKLSLAAERSEAIAAASRSHFMQTCHQ